MSNLHCLDVRIVIGVRSTRKSLIFVTTVIWAVIRLGRSCDKIQGIYAVEEDNMAAQQLTFKEIFWIVYTYFVMLFPIVITNTYIHNVKGRCFLSRGFFCVQIFGLLGILTDFVLFTTGLNKSKLVADLSAIFNVLLPARFRNSFCVFRPLSVYWEIFMCSSLLYMFFTAFRVYQRLLDRWEREMEEEHRSI